MIIKMVLMLLSYTVGLGAFSVIGTFYVDLYFKSGWADYILLSPRTTKLWRGYRVCPVRMYVSTYVRTFVRSYVHPL